MTLLIDNQTGSDLLIPILREFVPNHESIIKEDRLPSGDAAWEGWLGGEQVKFGVEVKHLPDIIRCIKDGRFVSQLKRMHQVFDVYYLLVVDDIKSDSEGYVLLKKMFGGVVPKFVRPFGPFGRKDFKYSDLTSWLSTMELLGGCHLWVVPDNQTACRWIYTKYLWSQKKKHKSLDVFDTSRPAPRKKGGVQFMGKPSEVMKVATALVPGLAWEKSRALSKKFSSVEEFFDAAKVGPEALQTKGVGPKLAARIVEYYRKRNRKEGGKEGSKGGSK